MKNAKSKDLTPIRVFIAMDIGEESREILQEMQNELKKTGSDIRWVKTNGIHLTLKFLGNIPEDKLNPIADGMDRAAKGIPPMEIRVNGFGAFPSTTRPRVVWVGINGPEQLKSLYERIEAEMEGVGFQRETRKFHPHLTLGRVRSPRGQEKLLPFFESWKDREVGFFVARELIMFKSTLLPGGAEYSRLRSVPFGQN